MQVLTQHLTTVQRKEIEEAFDILDTDGSGMLLYAACA